jgi:hypothetical protein
MNVKIALLTLLVILAATTIFAATAAAFNEAPAITSIKTNLNEENSNYVSLVGDPRGGDWPQVTSSFKS